MADKNTINFEALEEYVNVHRDELLVKASLGTKTIDYLDIMTNVKSRESIPYLESEVVLKKADCEWNPGGEDIFSERYVTVVPIESQKEYCFLDFQKYFMNYQMLFEAGREKLPFEQKIAESNMAKVQEAVENMIWNGDTDIDRDNLGILDRVREESGLTHLVTFETGQTVSDKIDAVVAAIPMSALKKGVNVFMSYTDFRAYIQEQNAVCCANKPMIDAASESLKYFGDSRITLVPVQGLEGADAIVAFPKDAVIYATDIEGSETRYDGWFEKGTRLFKYDVLFNFGIALRWPDEVVLGE